MVKYIYLIALAALCACGISTPEVEEPIDTTSQDTMQIDISRTDTIVVYGKDSIITKVITITDTIVDRTVDTVVSVFRIDTVDITHIDTITKLDTVMVTVYDRIIDTAYIDRFDTVHSTSVDTIHVTDTITIIQRDTITVSLLDTIASASPIVDTIIDPKALRDTTITQSYVLANVNITRSYTGKIYKNVFYLNTVYNYSDSGYVLYSYKSEYVSDKVAKEYYRPSRCGEINPPSHGDWVFSYTNSNGSVISSSAKYYTMPGWRLFNSADVDSLGDAIKYIIPSGITVLADTKQRVENKAYALNTVNSNGEINGEIPPKYYMCAYELN